LHQNGFIRDINRNSYCHRTPDYVVVRPCCDCAVIVNNCYRLAILRLDRFQRYSARDYSSSTAYSQQRAHEKNLTSICRRNAGNSFRRYILFALLISVVIHRYCLRRVSKLQISVVRRLFIPKAVPS
jgi:hypothetical protein